MTDPAVSPRRSSPLEERGRVEACLLLVHWAEVARHLPGCSPALLSHALHRRLCDEYSQLRAVVLLPSSAGTELKRVFEGWGFETVASDERRLADLLPTAPEGAEVLAVATAATALELLEAGRHCETTLRIWTPESTAGAACRGAELRLLEDELHLETAHPVGLFVDWPYVVRAPAARAEGARSTLMYRLLWAARLTGSLVAARIFGLPGHPEGADLAGTAAAWPDLSAAEPDGSQPLQAELETLLDDPYAPHTWILTTEADWLPELAARARGRGIRVLWWRARPARESAPPEWEMDGCADLTPFLETASHGSAWDGGAPIRASHTVIRTRVEPRESAETPLPAAGAAPGPLPTDARLGPWLRLLFHTECALRQHGWSRISLRRLAAYLAEVDEFGPTSANSLVWLNRARDEALLLVDQESRAGEAAPRVTVCYPNAEHPVARAAVEVPDRCLRLLRQMLHRMPWVSFKLLRNVLLREQWLGGPPYFLDETAVDEWLNFLIQCSAVRMSKEPNIENPDYPVTALRLNDQHPVARAYVPTPEEARRLSAERAVLAVDHFLIRNRKPWMAMSALRRSLATIHREELQTLLQGLQNLGALITESYPNPQKEHSTTGCRLRRDEPFVQATLQTRDLIVSAAQASPQLRGWVPLDHLEEELRRQLDTSPAEQRAWIRLLRDEGLLELDSELELEAETQWGEARCRLNAADPVVRTILGPSRGLS